MIGRSEKVMYPDIYFDPKFGKVYEDVESGKAIHIVVDSNNGTIENNVILREIPDKIDHEIYYDMTTPYGYGGPLITQLNGKKEKLLQDYSSFMRDFVKKNKIVSEFIRFHPIFSNHKDFETIYSVEQSGNTICTPISECDTFSLQFSKSAKKNIRKALKKGADIKVTESPESLESFKKIYFSTMGRNKATSYYYFGDSYFEKLINYYKKNLLLIEIFYENKVIAAGLYFIYNGIVQTHLSGTLTEYLWLSPAYLIRYAGTVWAEENHMKFIHHGGGTSNSKEDSLYQFKKRFSKEEDLKFYIGKKVWNKDMYKSLVNKKGSNDSNFFPKYRAANTEVQNKLLILGGSKISTQIVNAAKKKNIYTVVTDWYPYEKSPAKQIADKYYNVSTTDIEGLLDIIHKEEINGILTGFTDSALVPYANICEAAGLPCYGSEELFNLFTNKDRYKKLCREFDVPVIEEYKVTYEQIEKKDLPDNIQFPLLVKPSDSSGGRGVAICKNLNELNDAYCKALEYSDSNTVLVERFLEGEEATVFFVFDKGRIYLSGIGNRHIKKNQGEDTIALPVGYTFSSHIIPDYINNIIPKIKKMFDHVKIKDGIMFVQCMVDGKECIIYDMGYRLTGSLEYILQEKICGYNPLDMLIDYAFTGHMLNKNIDKEIIKPVWSKYGYNISFLIKTDRQIKSIEGIQEILNYPKVVDAVLAHEEGETVPLTSKGTLKQICLRVFGYADNVEELKESMSSIYHLLTIKSLNDENIILEGLNVHDIDGKLVDLNERKK